MVDRNVPDAAVGYRAILAIDENGDTGEVICNPSPMGEANACLIEAAPDLLAALLDALPYVEDVLDNPEQLACFKPGVVQRHTKAIRAAIAKATRGAP